MWRVWWERKRLQFRTAKQSARGAYCYRDTWYVYVEADGVVGKGECGMLRGYSVDDVPDYEEQIDEACRWMAQHGTLPEDGPWRSYPSIRMGLEMAWLHWRAGGTAVLFSSPFVEGKRSLSVQALIATGDEESFWHQIQSAVDKGYTCVKIKMGTRPWEEEYDQLRMLRSVYSADRLRLRLDVNGSWDLEAAMAHLRALEALDIDYIEQPLPPGRLLELDRLLQHSDVPIALDEELSYWTVRDSPERLFDHVLPHALVIKPTGLGGFRCADVWRREADKRGIAWWVASTWESGWGTFAIAQWTGLVDQGQCHGLGTVELYVDDYQPPLYIQEGQLYWDSAAAQSPKELEQT